MKKHNLLLAALVFIMVFAFSACGGDDSDEGGSSSGGDKTFHTQASSAIESDYETVVYTYSDTDVDEDLYASTVTIEYDGDKVMTVTEVMVDDMSAADDDIFKLLVNDYDGALDDTGFNEMEGFKSDVTLEGKVRTEIKKFDMTKFDTKVYKSYVGIQDDIDYVSLESLVDRYETDGFTKAE